MRLVLTLCVMCAALSAAPSARAAGGPPAEAIAKLRDYKAEKDDWLPLLSAVVPQLAPVYLALPPGAAIERGGPIEAALSARDKLDGPSSAPVVVYKKEDGRLPGAFIVQRYRGVTPAQIAQRLIPRDAALRHPLVDQCLDVTALESAPAGDYGDGAQVQKKSAMFALKMPLGAGWFGLRSSYAFGDWELATLPNGVALLRFTNRPAKPEERVKFAAFKDKKDQQLALDDTHFEAREYRLSHLFVPERDPAGGTNTIHVYFVRIVPALKPGTDLVGSGALARWVFAKGAHDALVTPVRIIRDEVERVRAGK